MNTITSPARTTYSTLGDYLTGLSKSALVSARYDSTGDFPRLFMPHSVEALLAVRFPGIAFDVEAAIEELEALSVDPVLERELFSVICIEHRIR